MNLWEKIRILANAFAAVLIPLIVAYTGHVYTKAMKDREVEGRFVELGITILQQEPQPENRSIRDWAVNVLNKYSGVSIDPATREQLIKGVSITKEQGGRNVKTYVTNDAKLSVEGTTIKRGNFSRENDQLTCEINISPPPNVRKISFESVLTPSGIYQSNLLLGSQKLVNLNYPVKKTFNVKPGESNSFKFSYFVNKDFMAQGTEISMRMNIGRGAFQVDFHNVPIR